MFIAVWQDYTGLAFWMVNWRAHNFVNKRFKIFVDKVRHLKSFKTLKYCNLSHFCLIIH